MYSRRQVRLSIYITEHRSRRATEAHFNKLVLPKVNQWQHDASHRLLAIKIAKVLQAFMFIDAEKIIAGEQRSPKEQRSFTLYRVAIWGFQTLSLIRWFYVEYLLHTDPEALYWHGDFYRYVMDVVTSLTSHLRRQVLWRGDVDLQLFVDIFYVATVVHVNSDYVVHAFDG